MSLLRARSLTVTAILVATTVTGVAWASEELPTVSELQSRLTARLACAEAPGGMVAGMISRQGRVVAGVGVAGPAGSVPDGDTVFEVASVTKLFTGLLLADAAARGELRLEEPVAALLPPGGALPAGGELMTLLDLATHSAGLPREPEGFEPGKTYDAADLYQALAKVRLEGRPGAQARYSNLGLALLGDLLARRAGRDYETLLRERIAGPLGLASTTTTPGTTLAGHLAVGYDRRGRALPATAGLTAIPAATEVRSSANDLLTLLAAALGLQPTPLGPAFAAIAEPRREATVNLAAAPGIGLRHGLGTLIDLQEGRPLVFHGGDRFDGFSAFVAYDPQRARGVVVLSNSRRQLADVGWSLLDPSRQQEPCGHPEPAAVSMNAEAMAPFAGSYRVAEGLIVEVTVKGGRLRARMQGPLRAFDAIGGDRFYQRDARVTLSFGRDATGGVRSVYVQQGGQFLRGQRR
jgi:CubicO group peptidase (beta-lactamase class C family)